MIVRLRKNFTNGLKNELGAGHFSRVHNLERWEAKLVGISKKEIEGAFYATLMRCMSHIVPLVFLQIFKARSSQWPWGHARISEIECKKSIYLSSFVELSSFLIISAESTVW